MTGDADYESGGPHDDLPFERESYAYPTQAAFERVSDALCKMAVCSTELQYPKSAEKSDVIQQQAEKILQDIKDLELMMAMQRELTTEEAIELRRNPSEVFLDDVE